MQPKNLFTLFKQTFQDWSADKASRLAASMAYYTLFSLAPLLVLVIAIISFILGSNANVQQRVISQVGSTISPSAASAINGFINNQRANQGSGIISTIFGVILLILGASGVFGELQDALNTIWNVRVSPKLGFFGMIKKRFLSFTMILGVGFLLLVSLIISTAISAVAKYFGNLLPGAGTFLVQLINIVVSLGIITLLFALIYKYLPDAEIRWRDVWVGAFFTAILFTIGKFLLGLYLGRSSTTSVYGAAGSLVLILLWVYYSGQILFFGAEFTQVYARRHGEEIVPSKGAVRMTEADREQVGLNPRPQRQPGHPNVSPGIAAVPVTGPNEESTHPEITLPRHRRYPQRADLGLPPMSPAVKWFTRVTGALLGALGLAVVMQATNKPLPPEQRLMDENRRLLDEAGKLRAEADVLKNESKRMHREAKQLQSKKTDLEIFGEQMQGMGKRLGEVSSNIQKQSRKYKI